METIKEEKKAELKEIRNILRMMLILLCGIRGFNEEETKSICNKVKESNDWD